MLPSIADRSTPPRSCPLSTRSMCAATYGLPLTWAMRRPIAALISGATVPLNSTASGSAAIGSTEDGRAPSARTNAGASGEPRLFAPIDGIERDARRRRHAIAGLLREVREAGQRPRLRRIRDVLAGGQAGRRGDQDGGQSRQGEARRGTRHHVVIESTP